MTLLKKSGHPAGRWARYGNSSPISLGGDPETVLAGIGLERDPLRDLFCGTHVQE